MGATKLCQLGHHVLVDQHYYTSVVSVLPIVPNQIQEAKAAGDKKAVVWKYDDWSKRLPMAIWGRVVALGNLQSLWWQSCATSHVTYVIQLCQYMSNICHASLNFRKNTNTKFLLKKVRNVSSTYSSSCSRCICNR